MFTTLPQRKARIGRSSAWMPLKAPVTLVSITSCQASDARRLSGVRRPGRGQDRGRKGYQPFDHTSETEHLQGAAYLSARHPLASLLVWSGVAVRGASGIGVLALGRGKTGNAAGPRAAAAS